MGIHAKEKSLKDRYLDIIFPFKFTSMNVQGEILSGTRESILVGGITESEG